MMTFTTSTTAISFFVSLVVSSPECITAKFIHDKVHDVRRRHLVVSKNKQEQDLEKIMTSSCIDQTYTVSLFTDSHLSLILEPNQHDASSDSTFDKEPWCGETLVMEMEQTDKVIVSVEKEEYSKYHDNKPLLPLLDNISLKTLMDAFEQSETGLDTMDDYDIIDRNCATFVLNMMHELDIPTDDRFMLYTVERLYENGKIMEAVKKSDNLDKILVATGSSVTVDSPDDQLLALLVDRYVRNHQESKRMIDSV